MEKNNDNNSDAPDPFSIFQNTDNNSNKIEEFNSETPQAIFEKPKVTNNLKEITQIRCDKCYKIPSIEIIPTSKEITICMKCDCGQKNIDLNDYEKYLTPLSLINIPCSSLIHQNNENNIINASEYCNLCKKYLCKNCLLSHKEFQSNHKTMKIHDIDNLCPIDSDKLIGLCKSCKQCYCNICKKEHFEHNIKSFERMKIDEDNYFNLFSCLGKIKEIMDYNEKTKNDIIKLFKEKMKLIENAFKENEAKNKKLYNLIKQLLLDYSSYKNNVNFNVIKNIQFNCNFNFKSLELNFNSSTLDEITNKSLYYFKNYTIIKKEINTNYLNQIKIMKICVEPINSLILLKDNRIAASSLDSKIFIINPNKDYKIDFIIDNYSNGVRDLCETNSGNLLASYGNLGDSNIKIFNIEENSFRRNLWLWFLYKNNSNEI